VHTRVRSSAVLLALLVAMANIPTHVSTTSATVFTPDAQDAEDLVAGLGQLRGRGTVRFDPTGLELFEPYSSRVLAELQDEGIPFVVEDETFVRQLGEGRRDDGSAVLRLWQAQGEAAEVIGPNAERVAYVRGRRGPVAIFVEPIAGEAARSGYSAGGW
jgi:hypothetical protein